MGSGGTRVRCGSFTGTGAAISITSVGFQPSKVKLYNLTSKITLEWNEAMGEDGAGVVMTESTGVTMTVVTTTGVKPTDTGFDLGTAGVNVEDEVIYYEAHE
jgi:hypothetical protein